MSLPSTRREQHRGQPFWISLPFSSPLSVNPLSWMSRRPYAVNIFCWVFFSSFSDSVQFLFLTHILRPSGESKAGCKQVWKWGERVGKGGWLGTVFGGSGWDEGSLPWAGACMLELLVGTEEGAPRLSCQLTWDVQSRGREGRGELKALQPISQMGWTLCQSWLMLLGGIRLFWADALYPGWGSPRPPINCLLFTILLCPMGSSL